MTTRLLIVAAVALGLGACNATTAMDLPRIEHTGQVLVEPHEELAPIAFEMAIASLKRGTVIAHFPSAGNVGFSANLCNATYANNAVMEWDGGSALLGGWRDEVAEIFIETLQDAGYRVVGDPQALFKAREDRQSAKYLVAAKILELRGNLCEEHHWWDGRPLRRYAAEWYQRVEWSVYSTLERRVVATFETEGAGRQDQATAEGIMTAFNAAFASAGAALAQDPAFHDLLVGADVKAAKATPKGFSPITLAQRALRAGGFKAHRDDTLRAVVTVRSGTGHGSGFVVSDDGYILTNQHVVGGADEVAVVFDAGLEVTGRVVRSDRARDVALVKVPLRGLAALPIRLNAGLRSPDPVYAVGSPLYEQLKSTITKGVVSAWRTKQATGLELIQSDVDISGGNSGGPLLDENGNVVGLAVSGYGVDSLSSGLNFFIPIDSAMDHLGLVLENG